MFSRSKNTAVILELTVPLEDNSGSPHDRKTTNKLPVPAKKMATERTSFALEVGCWGSVVLNIHVSLKDVICVLFFVFSIPSMEPHKGWGETFGEQKRP